MIKDISAMVELHIKLQFDFGTHEYSFNEANINQKNRRLLDNDKIEV